MTDEQKKFIEEHNGTYVGGEMEKAFNNGATIEQVKYLWNHTESFMEFRPALRMLVLGFDMEYAKYFVEAELQYEAAFAAVRGFKAGITLEQARKYFGKHHEGSQVDGMCELLLSTTEENAEPYLRQMFRMRQFKAIAEGFKKGYTKEQIEIYAKPEVKAQTMQVACKMIDNGISEAAIRLVIDPAFSTHQLDILTDAVFNNVPYSVLQICANRKCSPTKMRYIIQGYQDGFTNLQLIRLANERQAGRLEAIYKEILKSNKKEASSSICTATTFESLRDSIIELSDSLTGAQKKELVNLIIFGES